MSQGDLQVGIAVPLLRSVGGFARIVERIKNCSGSLDTSIEVLAIDNSPDSHLAEGARRILSHDEMDGLVIAETRVGIPYARNAAIETAVNRNLDALVFIDDDEWPSREWLAALVHTWQMTRADIVLGPVGAVLPNNAPSWAHRSGIFDKDRKVGEGVEIRTAYSFNTLLSRRTLETLGPSFDPIFCRLGGSDHDYFKRAGPAGLRSVWSPRALVYEEISQERLSLLWVLKRGYRIGVAARLSAGLRLGRRKAGSKVAFLTLANLGYAVINVAGTWHSRLSWVESIRRFGIVVGLLIGDIIGYEEYGYQTPTVRRGRGT